MTRKESLGSERRGICVGLFCLLLIGFISPTGANSLLIEDEFAVEADLFSLLPESIQRAPDQLEGTVSYTVTVTVKDSASNPRYSTLVVYDQFSKLVTVATNTSLAPGESGIAELVLPAGTYSIYARIFGLLPQEFENIEISGDQELDLQIEAGNSDIPAYFPGSKYSPYVIKNDGVETAKFELNVTNTNVQSIQVFNEFARLMINGEVLGKFDLYDNGTNGDEVADDGIFSRNVISTTMNMRGISRRSDPASGEAYGSQTYTLYARHSVSGMDSIVHLPDTALGVVNKNLAERTVTELSSELRVGDYFANLVVTDFNPDNIKDHVKRFYEYFPDDFDFFIIFDAGVADGMNRHYAVKNSTEGIGWAISDNTESWGSAGSLLGVNRFSWSSDPPMLHEIMHQWAARLDALFHTDNFGSHWGYCDVNGILGGFDPESFVDNQDGSYTVSQLAPYGWASDNRRYADLEQYLAGFVPIDQVRSSYRVALNPVGGSTFSADAMESVTPTDLINQYGERIPNVSNAQKDFKAAVLVVSEEFLTASGNTWISLLSETVSDVADCSTCFSFHEATAALGTLDTFLGSYHADPCPGNPAMDCLFQNSFED